MELSLKKEQPEIIVCDWDGVMQLIEPKWMAGVISNKHIFEPYFRKEAFEEISKEYIEKLINRDSYYLNQYFRKEGIESNSELDEVFMRLYLEDEEFYDDIPITLFGKALLELTLHNGIQEIVFLSHTPYKDKDDKRKERVLYKYMEENNLDSSKVRFVSLNENQKKCEWIKNNIPHYTAFIDDRPDIMKSVILNTDNTGKTYLMPIFGYNMIEKNDDLKILTLPHMPFMLFNFENIIA